MPIYHFTEENIKKCALNKGCAEKILSGHYVRDNLSEICWWGGTRRTFNIDFEDVYSNACFDEYEIPKDHRDFLEQFLAYYNPVIDLDEDDDECI